MQRTKFQQLSNAVQIAEDTGNREALDELDRDVATALADGDINLAQAGELTLDIEIITDRMQRDGLTDEQANRLFHLEPLSE